MPVGLIRITGLRGRRLQNLHNLVVRNPGSWHHGQGEHQTECCQGGPTPPDELHLLAPARLDIRWVCRPPENNMARPRHA
jgi:hypothetical protein